MVGDPERERDDVEIRQDGEDAQGSQCGQISARRELFVVGKSTTSDTNDCMS